MRDRISFEHFEQQQTKWQETNQRQKEAIDRLLEIRQGLIDLCGDIIDGMPDTAAALWRSELERVKDGLPKKEEPSER